MKLYIALLHYPVYNKKGEVISTSITSFDLHDIARSALTFGVARYYVVNPQKAQREFAKRITDLWGELKSFDFNPTRAEAFEILSLKENLEEVISEIKAKCKKKPILIGTSAKDKYKDKKLSFEKLREKLKKDNVPYLLLFGTGWGMAESVMADTDYVLEPIIGKGKYNHLSVRSATAIILDRLISR